jgi:hypothetical protein
MPKILLSSKSHSNLAAKVSKQSKRNLHSWNKLIFANLLFSIVLCACMVKEKSSATLHTDGLIPPWDSAYFNPRSLTGYIHKDPESTFTLFNAIARLDSMAGSQSSWTAQPEANDSLRLSQMVDTGFVFPQNPEAIMPYAYDDSFRDDTLFRYAFGNGMFTVDHPCASIIVFSGKFLHPAKWLRNGLTVKEIIQAIGKPRYQQPGILRYLTKVPGARPATHPDDTLSTAADYNTFDIFEGITLYFAHDSLFAAVLQRSQPCH